MNKVEIIKELDKLNTDIEEVKRLIASAVKERAGIMADYFTKIEAANVVLADLENRRKHLLSMADKLNEVEEANACNAEFRSGGWK